MAKQKYEKGKLSLRGTKAAQTEKATEEAVKELSEQKVQIEETPKAAKKTRTYTKKVKVEPEPPKKVKTQRFTVDFPEDRYYNFKLEALKQRRTVKDMLLEAMEKTFGV